VFGVILFLETDDALHKGRLAKETIMRKRNVSSFAAICRAVGRMRDENRNVTESSIAKELGVTVSTVKNYLKMHPEFSLIVETTLKPPRKKFHAARLERMKVHLKQAFVLDWLKSRLDLRLR
jgi:predicted transcriptional regulator